jgi:hypothetical protein
MTLRSAAEETQQREKEKGRDLDGKETSYISSHICG